ncbi:MAG: hypothetical protein Ta2B_05640 [Termitinemataceae bacterium]|nr:MAG: hypothetical protein Ta2B_05640 [Termitinemataceae bacterium]
MKRKKILWIVGTSAALLFAVIAGCDLDIPPPPPQNMLIAKNIGQRLSIENIGFLNIIKGGDVIGTYSKLSEPQNNENEARITLADNKGNAFVASGEYTVDIIINLDTGMYLSVSELVVFDLGVGVLDLLDTARLASSTLMLRNAEAEITTGGITKLTVMQDARLAAVYDSNAAVDIIDTAAYIHLVDSAGKPFTESGVFTLDFEITLNGDTYISYCENIMFTGGSAAVDLSGTVPMLKSHLTFIGFEQEITFAMFEQLQIEDDSITVAMLDKSKEISSKGTNYYVPLAKPDGYGFTGTGTFYATITLKMDASTRRAVIHAPLEFQNGSSEINISGLPTSKANCLIISNCSSSFSEDAIQYAKINTASSTAAEWNHSDPVERIGSTVYIPMRQGGAMFNGSGFFFVSFEIISALNAFEVHRIRTPTYIAVRFTNGMGVIDFNYLVSHGFVLVENSPITLAPYQTPPSGGDLIYEYKNDTAAEKIYGVTLPAGVYCFEMNGGAGMLREFTHSGFTEYEMRENCHWGGYICEIIGFEESNYFRIRVGGNNYQHDAGFSYFESHGGAAVWVICDSKRYVLAAGGGSVDDDAPGGVSSEGEPADVLNPPAYAYGGDDDGDNGGDYDDESEGGDYDGGNNRNGFRGQSTTDAYVKIYRLNL